MTHEAEEHLAPIRALDGVTDMQDANEFDAAIKASPWANLNSTRATIQIGKAIIFIAAMLLAAVVALWAADVLAKATAEVTYIIVRSL